MYTYVFSLFTSFLLYPPSGVSDPSTVDPAASLGDLGLDSMMSVEVKQALERGFDISLATKEIRQLTLTKLTAIASGSGEQKSDSGSSGQSETLVVTDLKDEDLLATKLIIQLNDSNTATDPVYIVHPIEGKCSEQLLMAVEYLLIPIIVFEKTLSNKLL